MSGLAALLAGHDAPDVYQWHSAAHVPDVEHAVDHAGWRFAYLDGWTVEDGASFVKATVAALDLGEDCSDFEELATALTRVDGRGCAGVVLLWDGWSPLARHEEAAFRRALAVLGERASGDGVTFAALLRGDGPELDLPELPCKPG